jgi:hypothetical protein
MIVGRTHTRGLRGGVRAPQARFWRVHSDGSYVCHACRGTSSIRSHMVLQRSGGLRARAVIRYHVSVLSRVLTTGSVSALVVSEVVALLENVRRILRMLEWLPASSHVLFNPLAES